MAAKKRLRALVVENEPELRWCEVDALNEAGFEVEEAASAKEAQGKLRKGPFNLVCIDKNLEGNRGYGGSMELIRSVQLKSPRSHVAVISAEGSPGRAVDITFIDKCDLFGEGGLKKLVSQVKRNPWRKKPSQVTPLARALERPLVIKDSSGRLNLFRFIEGDPMPFEASRLIDYGGRILNVKEALDDPMCKGPLRKTLLQHQQTMTGFIGRSLARRAAARKKPQRPQTRRRGRYL